MSKFATTKISINLLPKDEFLLGSIGKAIRWMVGVGRYLVIFTEVIFIISFASRFSLDRKVTDLNQEINKKVAIIESYAGLESEFRSAQEKLSQYSELEKQRNLTEVFEQISTVTPPEVVVTQLMVKQDGLSISGSTLSQTAFNQLINNLQLSPSFTDIRIDSVENTDDSSGYEFRLQAKLKNAK